MTLSPTSNVTVPPVLERYMEGRSRSSSSLSIAHFRGIFNEKWPKIRRFSAFLANREPRPPNAERCGLGTTRDDSGELNVKCRWSARLPTTGPSVGLTSTVHRSLNQPPSLRPTSVPPTNLRPSDQPPSLRPTSVPPTKPPSLSEGIGNRSPASMRNQALV